MVERRYIGVSLSLGGGRTDTNNCGSLSNTVVSHVIFHTANAGRVNNRQSKKSFPVGGHGG